MLRETRTEKVGVSAQPEEPIPLLHPLERARGMEHAFAIHDLGVLLERLAPHAVPALVRLLVEVRGIALEDALDERLHSRAMQGIGGADELIVRDAEATPHRGEVAGERVHEKLWRDALRVGRLLHLLAVLVHPDEKVHGVATQPAISCDRVGADLLVRVAKVWVAV